MRKVGIMGGTFDPIHNGHIVIAEYAYTEFGLDEVLFIPTGEPPHKTDLLTPGEDRLHMVQLAVAGIPWAKASDIEIRRKGTTYTIDTLHTLHAMYKDAEFYFIVGEDTLPLIMTWRHAPEVAALTKFLAVERGGVTLDMRRIQKQAAEEIGAEIHFMHGEGPEISSSGIRERLRDGMDVSEWIPEPVREYIAEHGLYGIGETRDENQI